MAMRGPPAKTAWIGPPIHPSPSCGSAVNAPIMLAITTTPPAMRTTHDTTRRADENGGMMPILSAAARQAKRRKSREPRARDNDAETGVRLAIARPNPSPTEPSIRSRFATVVSTASQRRARTRRPLSAENRTEHRPQPRNRAQNRRSVRVAGARRVGLGGEWVMSAQVRHARDAPSHQAGAVLRPRGVRIHDVTLVRPARAPGRRRRAARRLRPSAGLRVPARGELRGGAAAQGLRCACW